MKKKDEKSKMTKRMAIKRIDEITRLFLKKARVEQHEEKG